MSERNDGAHLAGDQSTVFLGRTIAPYAWVREFARKRIQSVRCREQKEHERDSRVACV